MSPRLLLEEMTRTEAKSAAAIGALVVWPLGAIEQHGPHLPAGTDTITVEHLVRHAAERAAQALPIVVAPTLPFGSSHHHLPFGGTMSLGSEAYYRTVCDLMESLIQGGFTRFFLINGHGGNDEILQLVARDLALKHPVSIAAASYWTVAWDALIALDAHVECRLPGHAGKFETSNILALRPDLVREPLPHRDSVASTDPRGFMRPYRAEHSGSWQKIDGYTDSPDLADSRRGRAWLDAIVVALANAMIEFHEQS
jgi:creatinine amidohydrolase